MGQQYQPYYSKRFLCWDEENRLVSFADCENAGFYQYDANGERTYKLAGGIAMQNIQGHWRSYNLLDNPTLYTSPYLVATPKGYTKHYYAESERVASRIGGGGLGDITRTIMNMEDFLTGSWVGEDGLRWEEVWIPEFYEAKQEESRNHLTDVMMCAGADPIVEENRLDELRFYWQYIQEEEETDCYWYHPDHLGSSSWITEKGGYSAQHLHYLPWGENFVDQRTTNYAARYTFSAKEKDAETGYSYFGARYYSSDLSIWLSVDPMSDKYPSLSPYVYCANNPIKLVDPNGEDWYESEDGKSLIFIYGETGQREGYKNLGAHLGQEYKDRIKNGDYSTVSMSANFVNDDFVAQKAGECCKAAKQMCINRGGENSSYANELAIVSTGINGEAGGSGIPENFVFGIEKLCSSLENGIPVVAGVDYGPGSSNPIKDGGDGMTDHYVAIIGVTLNFSKNNTTGETSLSGGNLQYANPGNESPHKGLSSSNLFNINISKNYRVERYVNNGVRLTVTNLRVK